MFDYTKGDNVWKDRTAGFLKRAETLFFNPMQESNNIMYEAACETGETGRHCNLDQQSFKAYLARFMAKTAIMAPFTKDNITKLLKASAAGAALSCSGGADKSTCGSKWYTGNWDGTSGVGQQLSALEVTQALLTIKRNIMPAKKDAAPPQPKPSSTPAASPAPVSSSQANVPSPSSQAPAPASSSKAPVPASSSKDPAPSVAPPTSSTMKSVQPAAPSVAPVSSGGGASSSTASATLVKPSVSTKTSPPAHSSPGANLGGVFGEKNSTSTSCTTTTTVYVQPSSSCTPSTTVTVYVPPKSQIASSGAPVLATSSGIMPPANSSVPKPTQPLEFIGAAGQVGATVGSIMGAAIVAMVAVML
jgi:mannan endo-1,6-alpha-mannosidase